MGAKELGGRVTARVGAGEDGFTLIELLVVVAILGALLAIAVPSYLGFEGRAADHAAKANIRAALPNAEAYYSDNGSYTGMTVAALQSYDAGLASNLSIYGSPGATYCLTDTEHGHTWSVRGPGATGSSYVANGTCS